MLLRFLSSTSLDRAAPSRRALALKILFQLTPRSFLVESIAARLPSMSKRPLPKSEGPLKMREVARLAGVSIATISRVLHDSPLVDPKTAEHVRGVIRKVNYVPNGTGPALKSGRSRILGLIIPDLSNPFFADFINHFERQVVDRDQEMLLAITDHSPEQMRRCVRRMLMRGVEGIAILESEIETSSYETVLHNRVPLVTLNRLQLAPGVSDVAVDTLSGMTEAVAHLKALGHQRIGFLGGTSGQRISFARENSFLQALAAHQLSADRALLLDAGFRFEGGVRALGELLRLPQPPTAVLCANDLIAFGALQALYDAGLRPGEDLSVIGLDDLALCDMVYPKLTTLHLSRESLVRQYLQALDQLRKDPHRQGSQFTQKVNLVIRQTTGPHRASAARSSRSRKARG